MSVGGAADLWRNRDVKLPVNKNNCKHRNVDVLKWITAKMRWKRTKSSGRTLSWIQHHFAPPFLQLLLVKLELDDLVSC